MLHMLRNKRDAYKDTLSRWRSKTNHVKMMTKYPHLKCVIKEGWNNRNFEEKRSQWIELSWGLLVEVAVELDFEVYVGSLHRKNQEEVCLQRGETKVWLGSLRSQATVAILYGREVGKDIFHINIFLVIFS